MDITVKQLKEALNKIDNDNEKIYIEAGFGCSDIHVCYNVVQLENGKVILKCDGHYADNDREDTDFDFNIREIKLITRENNNE